MNGQMPKALMFGGRQINFVGKGRDTGAGHYLDNLSGMVHEIFVAAVERTGASYSLARLAGNPALGLVRIDHSTLNGSGPSRIGDTLLVGPIQYAKTGPKAHSAWRLRIREQGSKPTSARGLGMIVEVAETGAYGWILAEPTGRKLFVHQSQLQAGAVLARGRRVSYVEANNGRGPTAYDVRPEK